MNDTRNCEKTTMKNVECSLWYYKKKNSLSVSPKQVYRFVCFFFLFPHDQLLNQIALLHIWRPYMNLSS